MNLVFFIRSETVNLNDFKIKDLPGSSGRLDVVCRCILAALFNNDTLEKKVQLWVFLSKYGTFVFNSSDLDPIYFPKTEISLAKYWVDFIFKKKESDQSLDIRVSRLDFFEALTKFIDNNYEIFVLSEDGKDFDQYLKNKPLDSKLLFIMGDQTGNLLKNEALRKMNLLNLSIGAKSYLASSVIRLVKIKLRNHGKTFKF